MKKGLHKTIQASFLVASMCFTTIGVNSFDIFADDAVIIKDNSGLYTVSVEENLTDGKLYECPYEKILVSDKVDSIGKYAFAKSLSLKEIELSDKIELVANGLCFGCENLESINLDGVKEIGNYAFSDCKNLKDVKLSKDIKRIGVRAFYNCSSIKNIEVSGNVEEIEDEVFSGCSNLSNIKLNEGIKTIGKGAFFDCDGLTNVKIPDGVLSIENVSFKNCDNLYNVEIPESVNYISASAFAECGKKLVIVAKKDSYAYKYAVNNDIKVSENLVVEAKKDEKIDISDANVSLDSSIYYYDGKRHVPKVTVKMSGYILKQGIDYNLVYTGNKKPGIWKAQVLGKGDYEGSLSKDYKIIVTPVRGFRIKNVKKRSIKIFAKKRNASKNITGYQIAYKDIKNRRFKRINTLNTGKLEYVLGRFKKYKTYQVKVRCFVNTNGRMSYSKWSGIKQVKIKK